MKILKFLFITLFLVGVSVSAQNISDNTLGLRLGDSDGFGAEISYQKAIVRYNRAEFNLGWRDSRAYDAFKLSGVYQWGHLLSTNFNWYYGAGGGLGNVDFEPTIRNNAPYQPDGGLFVFAAGNIGVEYNFEFPLLLSFDIRPEIGILGYDDFDNGFDFDIALGVRYQF